MPRNESKERETTGWLEKATEDLESAKILFNANKPTQWHQVLFFCQQTVEKAMKGFLTWHETKFRWTHDLVEIGNQCIQIDPELEKDISLVTHLSDYAWEFRYPGEDPDPTKIEAKEGIEFSETFLNMLLKKLPNEVRPKNVSTENV